MCERKVAHTQIDGNRGSSDIYEHPGANIEFGGENTGQLIEYVRSYDPRQVVSRLNDGCD
jgi:hypothetical protein